MVLIPSASCRNRFWTCGLWARCSTRQNSASSLRRGPSSENGVRRPHLPIHRSRAHVRQPYRASQRSHRRTPSESPRSPLPWLVRGDQLGSAWQTGATNQDPSSLSPPRYPTHPALPSGGTTQTAAELILECQRKAKPAFRVQVQLEVPGPGMHNATIRAGFLQHPARNTSRAERKIEAPIRCKSPDPERGCPELEAHN